jgi:hypothetical protein
MGLRRRVEAARALAIACPVILLLGVNAHVLRLTSTRRRETDIVPYGKGMKVTQAFLAI